MIESQNSESYALGSSLGQKTQYVGQYDALLLHAIERQNYRQTIQAESSGSEQNLAKAYGADLWQAYEVSWLDLNGKPCVGGLSIYVPCDSKAICESKSLKLYLNSFNQTQFESVAKVLETVRSDLNALTQSDCIVEFVDISAHSFAKLEWTLDQSSTTERLNERTLVINWDEVTNLDLLEVSCDTYSRDVSLLKQASLQKRREAPSLQQYASHLLRTNCPITNQPDWATLYIAVIEKSSDEKAVDNAASLMPESLLKYIVSYRTHNGFHEQTVEQIYQDLITVLNLDFLVVAALYTRRGGIDICPMRASQPVALSVPRIGRN